MSCAETVTVAATVLVGYLWSGFGWHWVFAAFIFAVGRSSLIQVRRLALVKAVDRTSG